MGRLDPRFLLADRADDCLDRGQKPAAVFQAFGHHQIGQAAIATFHRILVVAAIARLGEFQIQFIRQWGDRLLGQFRRRRNDSPIAIDRGELLPDLAIFDRASHAARLVGQHGGDLGNALGVDGKGNRPRLARLFGRFRPSATSKQVRQPEATRAVAHTQPKVMNRDSHGTI